MQRQLFLLLFVTFLSSCKPATVDTPVGGTVKPSTEKIVIIGSSTAAGWGASEYKYSWAGRLTQQLSTSRVVNLAKGGYTSYQLLPTKSSRPNNRPDADTLRNINAALKEKPTILIISNSSNDVVAGYGVDEVIDNFNVIRSRAFAAGVGTVIITTPIPRKFNADVTAKLLLQRDLVMKSYGSFAVNIFDPVANSDNLMKPELLSEDGIHPNDKGHEVIFKIISSFLL
ncbi:SGNH/GDSL hydrolase family protein [Spirosoma linguale]|uniref:Lipolytic protein G-D-S-L family n=1 Tax=Spirosoma linguale (strain ATCC 33905 / DSM 74 / LMG 10896 / Claus 1) TaxID=504472 RepID=D2QNB8_SPILD|nr:lipolytic protein G-D-S-L family [Spirosoma linguale DSM 74]